MAERKIHTLKARDILTVSRAAADFGVDPEMLTLDTDNILHLAQAHVRLPEDAEKLDDAEREKVIALAEKIRRSGAILTNPYTEWRVLSNVTQPAAVDLLTNAVALNRIFMENGLGCADILLPSGIDSIECRNRERRGRTDFTYSYCREAVGLTLESMIWVPPTELPLTDVTVDSRSKRTTNIYGFYMTLRRPDGGVPHRHQVSWSQTK